MPAAADDVKTVEPPVQNDAVPEIVGVLGVAVTVTVVPAETADGQPPTVAITV